MRDRRNNARSPGALDQVARRLPAAVPPRADELDPLTEREHEVLRMLANGTGFKP